MLVFTEKEKKILERYILGAVVRKEDEITLNKYEAIGFVSIGLDWDNMVPTAKLTPSGKKHLLMELPKQKNIYTAIAVYILVILVILVILLFQTTTEPLMSVEEFWMP